MGRPYEIKTPITDLASLRREKMRLRAHIDMNDRQLRERINKMPLLALMRTAGNVASLVVQSKLGGIAGDILGNIKPGKKRRSFMNELLKATAIFAATKLASHFMNKQRQEGDESDEEEEDLPDLSE